jgi:uncharacterized LabA/DUF88 family protein
MVADELRRQADHFLELQDLASEIARAPQQRPQQDYMDDTAEIVG